MTELPPVPQKIQDDLLHLLARNGFVENAAHTANTFAKLNPMNLPKCFHELREFILEIETTQGSPEDQTTVELEKAARQSERMERIQK